MNTIIEIPASLRSTTASGTAIIWSGETYVVDPGAPLDSTDSSSYFPEGIVYENWVGVVKPDSRDAFADRLDFLESFDDE